MNEVTLVGNLGRAPELKNTATGKAVCVLSVATTERFSTGERTEWHRVVAWEAIGLAAAKYLGAGRKVLVRGRLQTRRYTGADGIERAVTEVIAQRIEYLDRAPIGPPVEEEIPVAASPEVTPAPARVLHQEEETPGATFDNDDLPF